jgi:hypothetical protein
MSTVPATIPPANIAAKFPSDRLSIGFPQMSALAARNTMVAI